MVVFYFPPSSLLPLDKWSPALQIRTVLLSIQALLSAPNPDDPLANDVADDWKRDESHAIETGEDLIYVVAVKDSQLEELNGQQFSTRISTILVQILVLQHCVA